ncbi:Putative pentatricopeptide repeat-containing protein At1g17630 [Linum grandiflorum]
MRHASASRSLLHHATDPTRSATSFLRRYQTQIMHIHTEFLNPLDHHLLQCCAKLHQCEQVHASIIVSGSTKSAFLGSLLVSTYARFGRLSIAQMIFDSAPLVCFSNSLFWNSILRANVTGESYANTLRLYVRMRNVGTLGDGFTFPLVIRACKYLGSRSSSSRSSKLLCKAVHCHAVEAGFQNHVHVSNELIGMYAKLERMDDARKVFDRMRVRTTLSWNMMVSGFSFNCDGGGALEIFQRMESEGLQPNLVTWTSLMSSHARSGLHVETMTLFSSMRKRGIGVNAEALAVVLSVCSDLGAFVAGKSIHSHVLKDGFKDYVFVKHALICLYGKSGNATDAHSLFHEIANKNIVSWNALITSYTDAGLCDEALQILVQLERSVDDYRANLVSWTALISGFASNERWEEALCLFRQMQCANVASNPVTACSVLSACAQLSALKLGKEIHGYTTRRSFMRNNILVQNGLIDMYTKCGCLREGRLVFEKLERKDLISWNSMIKGFGMHGLGLDALHTFNHMIACGQKPDGITFVAVLSACSHAGLVDEGRLLFDRMTRHYLIEPQMEHYACMVDLLGRSGLLEEASDVVKNMPMEPNAYVLGALLNSCRMHTKNTVVAENTASQMLSLTSETASSYMLLSNIYAASGRWDDSARTRVSARSKGLKKTPGESSIEVNNVFRKFSAGDYVKGDSEDICRVLEELTLQMEDRYLH